MGYYNSALIKVTFPNHRTFSRKYMLEEYIEELKDSIKYYTEKLYAMVLMTEPKKFIPEDSDPISYLKSEYDDIIEELTSAIHWLAYAQPLLDIWDKIHDEKDNVIYNPLVENHMSDMQYLSGDYITRAFKDKSLGDDIRLEKVSTQQMIDQINGLTDGILNSKVKQRQH